MSRRAAVIGLGLIGGSVARRLVAGGWTVGGIDRDPRTAEAAAGHEIDVAESVEGLRPAPELVVVAVPPEHVADTVSSALDAWPDAVVTDVASVKQPIIESLRASGRDLTRYLPGHPLTGGPTGGYLASDPELFDGAIWALCPLEETPVETLGLIGAFLDAAGALALISAADAHDRAVARTSHLPHVVATALAAVAVSEPVRMTAMLSGPGLRDSIRIASADMDLWWDILRSNRAELFVALDECERVIADLRSAISSGNYEGAADIWTRGQVAQALVVQTRWADREFDEVAQPISAGWGPLHQLGERGQVLRHLRVRDGRVEAEASRPHPEAEDGAPAPAS